MAAKEPLLPQDAGKGPVRRVPHNTRMDKDGNARGSAQAGGREPACTPYIAHCGWAAKDLSCDLDVS